MKKAVYLLPLLSAVALGMSCATSPHTAREDDLRLLREEEMRARREEPAPAVSLAGELFSWIAGFIGN